MHRGGVQTAPAGPVKPRPGRRAAASTMVAMTTTPASTPRDRRVSNRIGAIAESATLKVDAKAKALKAEGRPVIGFGAGEPDFPTPDYIVEAAVEACRDPKNHRYTPAGGPPRAEEGDRREDAARQRVRRRAGPGAGHQRRQAGDLRRVRGDARPGRRGDRPRAVLDDVPRVDPARRRRDRRGAGRRDPGLQGHRRAARGRPHREDQGAAVRLALEPDRRGLHRRRDPGDRAVGRGPPAVGAHRRDLRAPRLRRRRDRLAAGAVPVPRRQLRRGQRRREDLRHDRLAGRLDDRPEGPGQGRHQPAVARHVERLQRRAARGAGRGLGRPVRGRGDEGGVRPAPEDHRVDAQRDRRRRLPDPARRVLRLPVGEGAARQGVRRPGHRLVRRRSPSTSSTRPRSRSCPAEAFGSPGYLRLSYALGDDDLVEGITRLQKLFS